MVQQIAVLDSTVGNLQVLHDHHAAKSTLLVGEPSNQSISWHPNPGQKGSSSMFQGFLKISSLDILYVDI